MKIRKVVYTIAYTHILTFREYYRAIIAPYFDYQGLEYGIDNENTLKETIKLVYKSSGIIMQFNKEVATFFYEGDIADIKKQNPVIEIFFDILEKIKRINGFVKIANHKVELTFIDILETSEVEKFLTENIYIYNPFSKVKEVGVSFEFNIDEKECKFQFGNYNEKDIIKFGISPLNTDYNKDLIGNVGLMSQLVYVEKTTTGSFSKFKSFLGEGEQLLTKYLDKKDGK